MYLLWSIIHSKEDSSTRERPKAKKLDRCSGPGDAEVRSVKLKPVARGPAPVGTSMQEQDIVDMRRAESRLIDHLREKGRGGCDKEDFSHSSKARSHGALAFFAAVLTFLCHDKVVSRFGVTKAITYRCELCSPHFILEGLAQITIVSVGYASHSQYMGTCLSASDSDLKCVSKSFNNPCLPGCVPFQWRMHMFL